MAAQAAPNLSHLLQYHTDNYGATSTSELKCSSGHQTQADCNDEHKAPGQARDPGGADREETGVYALPRHSQTRHGLCVLNLCKHHGVQEVRKAAKKAADFELRKVVKRLKAARSVLQLLHGVTAT